VNKLENKIYNILETNFEANNMQIYKDTKNKVMIIVET